ncbi:MAG TPA: glycosyltransferase family 9 protein [Candidatus Sulfotelmatobacter sp.]|nr:glycosyltransferase family 9 protein [Candidatus Sulfotelmatobacter sp.]
MATQPRILVIKHSALGDFIQAMGPFAAIRAHHKDARITLLTTKPYAEMGRICPYFDEVWTDPLPKAWDVTGMMKLRRLLRSVKFDMVYDLQTSERSNSYFHTMGDPPWSGIAHGCEYFHANHDRDLMHVMERQTEQLAMAGIPETPSPDLSWLDADLSALHPPKRFVLMAPGGAAHRPHSRWPSDRFAALGNLLGLKGISTVVLGTRLDHDAIKVIVGNCPTAMSLADRTPFAVIAALARKALGAVGNDTGPMQLIAAAGCPSVVLFSAETDPAVCAPRGAVACLQNESLTDLPVENVAAALESGPAALREAA